MTLFESWKDSIKLCKPEAIKLFALITLKSVYEVLRVLSVAWFLIPIIFFVCLATLLTGAHGFITSVSFVSGVASIFFLIAARPSVGIKDFDYFRINMLRALWLILISVGIGILLMLPLFIPFIGVAILLCFLPSFFDLTILFYLDFYSEGVVAAFKRAFIMIWYNYPLFVIYVAGLYIIKLLILMPFSLLSPMLFPTDSTAPSLPIVAFISNLIYLCFALITKCVIVNLYIKRMHDQFELYQ